MPRLRLLADTAQADATGIDGADAAGNPVFSVGMGSVVPLVLDATGFVGSGTISTSVWDSPDGAALSAQALSGKFASCHAATPSGGQLARRRYRVENTLTLADGQVRTTLIWLRAESR